MKRTLIILLVAACVGITVYINMHTETLTPEQKSAVENRLLQESEFPARPVWWQDDSVLAIGVVAGQVNPNQAAGKACEILQRNGVYTTSVEIYDVVKIQKEDDWQKLAANPCIAR